MKDKNLEDLFHEARADYEGTLELLEIVNDSGFSQTNIVVSEIPAIDGKQILDLEDLNQFIISEDQWKEFSLKFLKNMGSYNWGTLSNDQRTFSKKELQEIGLFLSGNSAYGVLNGGSATSYVDVKKNSGLSKELFQIYEKHFQRIQPQLLGMPKGITPAFFQDDGSPGPSFLELKFRALLIQALARKALFPETEFPPITFFQMTSDETNNNLNNAYLNYQKSPLLQPLLSYFNLKEIPVETRIQSLIGTFTLPETGHPRRVFTYNKDGKNRIYALPGGHGQNFRVLKPLYEKYSRDNLFSFSIGNVDNLGYLPNFRGLVLLGLLEANAAFDFSFKTPVDIKGGVLVREKNGHLNCGDLGVGIPSQFISEAEENGSAILFNCASGYFSLDYMKDHLDFIIKNLPLRVSNQDKDVGKYSQVEQVTWEVLGLLEKPLIFAVDKKKRFLAAKILLENFISSALDIESFSDLDPQLAQFKALSQEMHLGLKQLLMGPYGLKLEKGHWIPLTIEELLTKWKKEGIDSLSF